MGDMRPTFAKGNKTAISKLLELRRQAQKDKEPRVVLRIQGILMSLDGETTGEIANHPRRILLLPQYRNHEGTCAVPETLAGAVRYLIKITSFCASL
jgi:hypothetical protein